MRAMIYALALGLPVMLEAGQPISESFVECAQLIDISNRYSPSRRNSAKGAALEYAAAQMMLGARREAAREGQRDIPVYLAEMAKLKAAAWDARGITYVMTQDFRDWMQYCRKLAASRDIRLTP